MSDSERILHEIEKQSAGRWLPIIGTEKARIIAIIVEEERPRRALEVGTNIGYSAIVIASHMPSGSQLTTIEVNHTLAREARSNIKRAGLSEKVNVLVGDALKLIPSVDGHIDFAFLDAEKAEYGQYLTLIEPKLHFNSVVVADNVGSYPRAMGDYLERVRRSGLYESKYIPVGWDGLEVSRMLPPT